MAVPGPVADQDLIRAGAAVGRAARGGHVVRKEWARFGERSV